LRFLQFEAATQQKKANQQILIECKFKKYWNENDKLFRFYIVYTMTTLMAYSNMFD